MKLHYREMGEGEPLMILHGLFGFSDNWQTHGKKLSEYYRVILVDLRNHGHSDWSEQFSYEIMSDDVKELCDELNLSELILLGHSMGGKVAINFAQKHEDLLKKLIIVDIGTKGYPMHHDHILQGIHSVKLEGVSSRRKAAEQMNEFIESEGIKQFLLKNLFWKEKGKLAWRMNIDVLERKMPNILGQMTDNEVMTPTLFIRGELSNYILDEDIEDLENQFPDSEFATVANAGHWVHAEAPGEFIDILLGFCLR
ncbi:MAG: pimeloyl-ACP methyl ester carboxylesterase [Crocinitomicaceae bacterium]|jgi:pimeloyl-ACP methyl ester carboxylesterase